jgi:uncharacterized membrane protein YphA (DoxX/SURF4 family)
MNGLTRVFLVVLRLVIGWHFLFEGVEKFRTDSWSSEAYLREASGPLAPEFHWLAGDPLVDRLTPLPAPAGQDPARVPPHERFPAALDRDWQTYFDAFVKHYQLDDRQRDLAAAKLAQRKDQTATWILNGPKNVIKPSPYGPPVVVEKETPERLREYEEKVRQAREYEANELPRSTHTLFAGEMNATLRTLKGEANRMRADLRADLAEQTKQMKDALREVLEPNQLAMPPLSEPVSRPMGTWTRLDWADALVRWGLVIVGVCLILGLFTRTACVIGAGYLLLFYLAMPALPGLPDNPRAEGHYFYVNKNIIEMLALLALATTHSGRWAGLDGILHYLNPWNWRARTAAIKEPRRGVPSLT